MSYIETISEAEATGVVKELYDAAEESVGYIPNYLKLFSQRPEAYKAWQQLISAIRKNMSLRRYELVTLAAARKLQSTYCMLAHSDTLLRKNEVDEGQLAAIATDYHQAQLTAEDIAVMEFAEKVIAKSGSITQADVDRLKGFGISDGEILDITLAATARSFFSKTLDALDAEPDPKYMDFEAGLRNSLAVGRPFGSANGSDRHS
ncbi:MAG: peroxidase-related enzyme [Anaerolineae bacterium]|nr:peroxidase-related enzyme [Anaerolineae bacterium]